MTLWHCWKVLDHLEWVAWWWGKGAWLEETQSLEAVFERTVRILATPFSGFAATVKWATSFTSPGLTAMAYCQHRLPMQPWSVYVCLVICLGCWQTPCPEFSCSHILSLNFYSPNLCGVGSVLVALDHGAGVWLPLYLPKFLSMCSRSLFFLSCT